MVCELEKISVRDTVLRVWASGDARPSSVGRKRWRAGRGSSIGRCVRLALGVGAGLGLLVNCMVVSAILLPLHLMVLPVVAAVVAVGLAVNVGVGAGSASASGSGPLDLLELSRLRSREELNLPELCTSPPAGTLATHRMVCATSAGSADVTAMK